MRTSTSNEFLKACRSGSPSTVRELLRHTPNAHDLRTKADETALHVAITHNPTPAPITTLLLEQGHDPNIRGYRSENKTPLHVAARRGCVNTVSALLSAGGRVDSVKRGDWTPLLIACANGYLDIVKLLLENGANVHAVNRLGEGCIHLSARTCEKCLRCCVGAGGGVFARTRAGKTGLHYAASVGRLECLKVLLGAGGGVRQTDCAGVNCVVEACGKGQVDVLKALREVDGDAVWIADDAGLNGLHHAAIVGAVDVVKVLLSVGGGGRLERVDRCGFTALRLALFNGHAPIVRMLLQAGARVENEWIDECTRLGKAECVREVVNYRSIHHTTTVV